MVIPLKDEETPMERINRLANDRFQLYLKAGHDPLSEFEQHRLEAISRELDSLWKQYRRELASKGFLSEWTKLDKKAA